MSDRYIEKSFLYLVALSILLHVALYQLVSLIPAGKPKTPEQTTMVDLSELPKPPPEPPKPVERKPVIRMKREPTAQSMPTPAGKPKPQAVAPSRQVPLPIPRPVAPPTKPEVLRQEGGRKAASLPKVTAPARTPEATPPTPTGRKSQSSIAPEKGASVPISRGEGIFKTRSGEPAAERPKLFPSAGRLASLEDSYRKKYSREVEEGKAIFLNSDDVRFTSFIHRLENAIYGVWQYPLAAQLHGTQGTVLVRVTFNRDGEIMQVDVLEGAGSKILDDEVLRTLHHLGPIGSLPKQYTGDTLKMLLFFIYGSAGRIR